MSWETVAGRMRLTKSRIANITPSTLESSRFDLYKSCCIPVLKMHSESMWSRVTVACRNARLCRLDMSSFSSHRVRRHETDYARKQAVPCTCVRHLALLRPLVTVQVEGQSRPIGTYLRGSPRLLESSCPSYALSIPSDESATRDGGCEASSPTPPSSSPSPSVLLWTERLGYTTGRTIRKTRKTMLYESSTELICFCGGSAHNITVPESQRGAPSVNACDHT